MNIEKNRQMERSVNAHHTLAIENKLLHMNIKPRLKTAITEVQ